MSDPFAKITIVPSYAAGFVFMWELTDGFSDPLPWKFKVQCAETSEGPWKDISGDLINSFAFADSEKRIVNKDFILIFRILLETPEGNYISYEKHPYGDLNRREHLIVRDIMRKELLQQDKMAAVESRLFPRSISGVECTSCTDPITGDVMVGDCKECLGTGKAPGYYGPYHVLTTFTPTKRNLELKPDGLGLEQPYTWNVRMVGFPFAKDNDIILDVASDKRYIVDGVNHELEIRRIPVVQTLHVKELPTSDPAYKLDTPLEGQEGCELR